MITSFLISAQNASLVGYPPLPAFQEFAGPLVFTLPA